MLVARMASCRVANAFSTRLKLIWLKFSPKTAKLSGKKVFSAKSSGGQWVNDQNVIKKYDISGANI